MIVTRGSRLTGAHLVIPIVITLALVSAEAGGASGQAIYRPAARDIVVLLNERTVTVTPSGDQNTVVRRKLEIGTAAGASRYVPQRIAWQAGRVSPFLLKVTVSRAGEQVFHLGPQQDGPDMPLYPAKPAPSAMPHSYLALPDLQRGDIVDWAVELRARPLIKGHFFANMEWQLQHRVNESIFTVTVPKGRKLEWRSWGEIPEPVVTEGADDVRYVWHTDEPTSPRDPANLTPNAQTWVSSGAAWRNIANWYLSRFERSGSDTEHLASQTADTIHGLNDYMDRARAIVGYVRSSAVTAESGEVLDPFSPQSPSQVLSTHYGDCKDKAWLMASMLRAAGLQAHMGLACLKLGLPRLREQLPTPLFFDHTVVGVSGPGRMLWIDPTGAAAHEVDAGRTVEALVISSDRPAIVTIDSFVRF